MKEYLESMGYSNLKKTSKGWCGIMRFIYTMGLVIGLDKVGYEGRYCFHSWEEAEESLSKWTGEGDPPGNWIKYKGEGGDRPNPNYIKDES